MSHLCLIRKQHKTKRNNIWGGQYKAAFFKQFEANHDDDLFKEFRPNFLKLPQVVHSHLLGFLSVSDRIALEQTCSYMYNLSRSTPWTVRSCEVTEGIRSFHIKLDDICHCLTYPEDNQEEMIRSIHSFMRNVNVTHRFKFSKPTRNDVDCFKVISAFRSYVCNVEEVEFQSVTVTSLLINIFFNTLKRCKIYRFHDVKFTTRTSIEEFWPALRRMQELSLHNVLNLQYEHILFTLLPNRPEPKLPIQKISILLRNRGIDPREIKAFARMTQEFDQNLLSKILIMFPAEWKKRRLMGGHRDSLYNLLASDYDESLKNRILISIHMLNEDQFQCASNGNLYSLPAF